MCKPGTGDAAFAVTIAITDGVWDVVLTNTRNSHASRGCGESSAEAWNGMMPVHHEP